MDTYENISTADAEHSLVKRRIVKKQNASKLLLPKIERINQSVVSANPPRDLSIYSKRTKMTVDTSHLLLNPLSHASAPQGNSLKASKEAVDLLYRKFNAKPLKHLWIPSSYQSKAHHTNTKNLPLSLLRLE